MSQPELGCYVYCLLGEREGPSLAGMTGVDPRYEVKVVRHRDVSAVVSQVRLDEFGAEPLKHNLEDLDWLERTARAHDAVIAQALRGAAVVPLRLCTIFGDETRVREMLDRRHAFLLDALDRLGGRAEWSVKLLADPHKAREAILGQASAGADGESESSGRAFFARKKAERALGEQVQGTIEGVAREAHERLERQAVAAVLLPAQNRALSHHTGEMVLNGAYLVDRSGTEAFAAVAQELRRRHGEIGVDVELSGPFAPYNFVVDMEPVTAAEGPR